MNNFSDIGNVLSSLFKTGDVVELRILNTRRGTVGGYFNDMGELTQAAKQWSGRAPGIYVTANPVNPDLLARSANHLKEYVKQTSSDLDIVKRRWFLLDFDPIRPAGISSTDEEHEAALARATEVRAWVKGIGWPEPIFGDSGNGAHLLCRIDLPNNTESTALIQRCLKALALRFTDEVVALDLTTYNAARIWKLYGTMACKGDSTPERPHRESQLLEVPKNIEVVGRDLLEKLAAMVPEEPKKERGNNRGNFDLPKWIQDHGLDVIGPHPWQGGQKWIFPVCPWNSDHTNKAAYLIQFAGGAIAAGCHHNGCAGKGWRDLRDTVEPENLTSDYREGPSEVKFEEVNAEALRDQIKAGGKTPLIFLPLLGQEGFFVKGWSHIVAAYPKSGKTELLVRVLSEWSQESILYITEEPRSVWEARLEKLPERYILNHVTLSFGLGKTPKEILDRIKTGNETVAVIDTIRNLLGLHDEKDNSEVARVMIPYIAATRQKGQTPIFVHHDKKSGGDDGRGITGGHAFLGVVNIAIELLRDKGNRRRLRGWGHVIEIPELLYEKQSDGTFKALGSPEAITLEEVKERAVLALDDNWQKTAKVEETLGDPKPSRDNLVKALEALAREGQAERDPPISAGKCQGVAYQWRRAPSFTSDSPSYTSEVKSEDKEKGPCPTFDL